MPLRTSTIEEPALNLTPMIDIVFLLVIFFMVGSQFTDLKREYKIQLAGVATAQPLTRNRPVVEVGLTEAGRFVFDGNVVASQELETHLAAAKKKEPDVMVRINADKRADVEPFVRALEVISSRAGIASSSISVKIKSGE